MSDYVKLKSKGVSEETREARDKVRRALNAARKALGDLQQAVADTQHNNDALLRAIERSTESLLWFEEWERTS